MARVCLRVACGEWTNKELDFDYAQFTTFDYTNQPPDLETSSGPPPAGYMAGQQT
ncbi:hypothetical protein DPMN_163358 [Dreissena polymorpha]|uniref:Uncharacterized protein n=1 Tax=Dreissena polymorpha TaxID=45954 RepID=A0A9D4ETA7_DREPO|nr:hypothetical protein DPMN_163358 [Dreissena polymorpha]